jgi:hypothetical protein
MVCKVIAITKEKLGLGFMFEEVSKPSFAYWNNEHATS